MATHKITRKVIIPVKSVVLNPDKTGVQDKEPIEVKIPEVDKTGVEEVAEAEDGTKRPATKRECFFCKSKSTPSYTDLGNLRRFLTDRAKIVAKERSGVCSKHQRGVAKNIKYARHLALLPFVPKV